MFLNFTNHPSADWGESQRRAVALYGQILDLPFPDVPPSLSAQEVEAQSRAWVERIAALSPDCVLCQGEMTFTYRVVEGLNRRGIPVVAACSERCSEVWTDGEGCTHRKTEFRFVRFRKYYP